jgi:hypothetical protein
VGLSANEKAALHVLIAELIEADESDVLLAVLARIADKMSFRSIRTSKYDDVERWLKLGEAITSVQKRLQSP